MSNAGSMPDATQSGNSESASASAKSRPRSHYLLKYDQSRKAAKDEEKKLIIGTRTRTVKGLSAAGISG